MKIYVVTKGCYSDYHIITATTDLKVAEAIKAKFDGDSWDETSIEVFENAKVMLRPLWFVDFKKDGTVRSVSEETNEYGYEILNQCKSRMNDEVFVYVTADTEKKAIKIAAEKRAEYLANKNGLQ